MNGVGALFIYVAAVFLVGVSLARRDATFRLGMRRALEQALAIFPRMIFALVAAVFIVKLIPTEIIGRYLGAEAGFTAILIGSLAGLMVPSGPVIAFATASTFAAEGASVPALVSFVTGWSVFAAHRVLIFEIPLLGTRFVRLRLLSVIPLPLLAGSIALFTSSY